ncbi:PilW family protein [Saccharophagus sp. K07]|jgi:type IV pilus assembly protein PilW|uniref:PilW family protein n=1 Tax=Saccharophagus sp. K07 TaxID=2283636 RepID=UPI001651DB62|nr:PilW family protein [Saccharophagus sp. K07]
MSAKQRFFYSTGMTVVELMIAIVISLLIMAGVVQVFFNSKTTFLAQEDMSYIQHNARYAMHLLTKDLQNAGYWGCAGRDPSVALVARTENSTDINRLLGYNPDSGYLEPLQPVTGFATGFPASYVSWTIKTKDGDRTPESLIVRNAAGVSSVLESHIGTNLTLKSQHNFSTGDLVTVVAEDCRRVALIKMADILENSTILKYSDTSICGDVIKPPKKQNIRCKPGCACDSVSGGGSKAYSVGSHVMPYNASGYFVGESPTLPGQPSLQRVIYDNGALTREELALGVEDLQVRYGVDTDNDGAPDTYVAPDVFTAAHWDNWSKVRSVQISLVFRSLEPSLPAVTAQSYLNRNYEDKFLRQLITATVRLRNAL